MLSIKKDKKIEDVETVGIKIENMKNILDQSGISTELELNTNYSMIKILNSETNYKILLSRLNKKRDRFLNLSFVADYSNSRNLVTSIKLINQYNSAHRFTKGYINDHGIIKIRTDWFLNYYVPNNQILTWIQLWDASLILFETFWFKTNQN